jgi:RpiR family transcriptional regulator, carbohydrate utilization regulator
MEQLIYTLLAYINNSLDKDINYSIAKSLLEHIDKIERFSLETAAEACNVAPSTINRFCKRLGFKNFSHLRSSAAMQVGHYSGVEKLLSPEILEKKLKENIEMIAKIKREQLERVTSKIYKSKKIVILGFEKNQIQALELQKRLLLLGKFCECSTNLFKQVDALSQLTEEDMIITISIQGNILMDEFSIIDKIKMAKGKKLLITFSDSLKQQEVFDELLQCGKIENSAVSAYTLLRMFDVLVYRYQEQYPS